MDLGSDDGIAQARALALSSDILVENFRPGLMESLGLSYEALAAEHPGLIYCSITGFGAHAPQLPGYDLLVQALGGLMSITGAPAGPPQKVGVALVDVLAGLFAVNGILAAVVHRSQTGEGQRVDVDLLSSLLAALVNQAAACTAGGVVPHRMGNRHPSITPYEAFQCGDGQLVVAVGNDRQFAALCTVLDAPELSQDPRFRNNSARVARREQLVTALEAALASRSAASWSERLLEARVPAGVVNDIAAAFDLASAIGLDPIVTLTTEDGTDVPLARNPIRLWATPPTYRRAPPAFPGQPAAGHSKPIIPPNPSTA